MNKKYESDLLNELGINSIQHRETIVSQSGIIEIIEIQSCRSDTIGLILEKCVKADLGNLPSEKFAAVVVAAKRVVDAHLNTLSKELEGLEKALNDL